MVSHEHSELTLGMMPSFQVERMTVDFVLI